MEKSSFLSSENMRNYPTMSDQFIQSPEKRNSAVSPERVHKIREKLNSFLNCSSSTDLSTIQIFKWKEDQTPKRIQNSNKEEKRESSREDMGALKMKLEINNKRKLCFFILVKEAYSIIAEKDCELIRQKKIIFQNKEQIKKIQNQYEMIYSSMKEANSNSMQKLHEESNYLRTL